MESRRPRKILKSPVAKRRSRVIPKDQKVMLLVNVVGGIILKSKFKLLKKACSLTVLMSVYDCGYQQKWGLCTSHL